MTLVDGKRFVQPMKIRNARKKTKAFKQVFIKASFALAVDAITLFYMLWRLKKNDMGYMPSIQAISNYSAYRLRPVYADRGIELILLIIEIFIEIRFRVV